MAVAVGVAEWVGAGAGVAVIGAGVAVIGAAEAIGAAADIDRAAGVEASSVLCCIAGRPADGCI